MEASSAEVQLEECQNHERTENEMGQTFCPFHQTISFLGQEKTKKTYSKPYSKKVNLFQDNTKKPAFLIILTIFILTSIDRDIAFAQVPFKTILPDTSKTHKPNWTYLMLTNLCDKLNVSKLEKGVDSFEFRLWCPVSEFEMSLITIKYASNAWLATQTFYSQRFPEQKFDRNNFYTNFLKVIIDSSKTMRLNPKIDIAKIVDSLKQFDILNVPTQFEINNAYMDVADGYRYIIEVANKDYYKMIDYTCPNMLSDADNYNRKVANFLKFIQRQFADFLIC